MTTPAVSGIDYLGRCYDIFDLDPLNMGATAKGPKAIRLSTDPDDQGGFNVPRGVNLTSPYATDVLTTEEIIYNSSDFQRAVESSLEIEAGFAAGDIGAKFGASHSFKEAVEKTQSRKQIFKYCMITVQNHVAELGDSALSKAAVTDEFAAAVGALPHDGAGEAAAKAYAGLIEKFGTHFATKLSLGGLAYQRVSTTVDAYKSKSEVRSSFGTNASLQLKVFSAGEKSTNAETVARTADSQHEMTRSELVFRGGTGSRYDVANEWFSDLHDRAVPIPLGMRMRRLSDLLSSSFFPDDPAIGAKHDRLVQELNRYIDERGGEVGAGLCYGDRVGVTSAASFTVEGGGAFLHADPSPGHRGVFFQRISIPMLIEPPRASIVLRHPDDPEKHYGEPIFTSKDIQQSSAVGLWVEELGGYLSWAYHPTVGAITSFTDDLTPQGRWVVRSPADLLPGRPPKPRQIVSGDALIFGHQIVDRPGMYFVIQIYYPAPEAANLSIESSGSDPLYGAVKGQPDQAYFTLSKLFTKL
jgi:hypothetical protein